MPGSPRSFIRTISPGVARHFRRHHVDVTPDTKLSRVEGVRRCDGTRRTPPVVSAKGVSPIAPFGPNAPFPEHSRIRPHETRREAETDTATGQGRRVAAVGRETQVLSFRGAVRALRTANVNAPVPGAEEERAALALAFMLWTRWQGMVRFQGGGPPENLGVSEDQVLGLRKQLGLGRERAARALTLLGTAGVLEETDGAGTTPGSAVLASEPFAPGLDWSWIIQRFRRSEVDPLTTWAMARRITAPSEWREVPLSEISEEVRASTKTLGRAVEHLVKEGVLERRAQPGKPDLFRFSEPSRGVAPPEIENRGESPHSPGSHAPSHRQTSEEQGTVMEVGGVRVEVPAGHTLTLERGKDGRLYCRLAPGWRVDVS